MVKKSIFVCFILTVFHVRADFIMDNKTGGNVEVDVWGPRAAFRARYALSPNEKRIISTKDLSIEELSIAPHLINERYRKPSLCKSFQLFIFPVPVDVSEMIRRPPGISFTMEPKYVEILKNAKLYMPTITIRRYDRRNQLDIHGEPLPDIAVFDFPKDVDALKAEIERVKAEVKKEAQAKLTAQEYQDLERAFTPEEATAPLGQGGKVKVPEPLRGLVGEYLVDE